MRTQNLKFKKSLAAIVLLTFSMQGVATAAPEAISIGTTRPSPAATPPSQVPNLSNPSDISIPFENVTLKEAHAGTNGKLIIHIQDAHSNFSGQMSLAKALDFFMKKYGINLVLTEGADRDVTLTDAKGITDQETWKIVAKRYLQDGLINGSEYLNLASTNPMKIRGVEYMDLYDKSLKTYSDLVDERKKIMVYLHQIHAVIDRLKAKLYPDTLRDYEKKKGSGADGESNFTETATELFNVADKAQVSLEIFPEISKLRQIQAKEKSLNFPSVNADLEKLLSGLRGAGHKEEADNYLVASKKIRNQQISQGHLLKDLVNTAKGLSVEVPAELADYAAYLDTFSDLQMDELLQEIDRAEDTVFKTLLPDEDQRRLRAVDRFVGLLDKAYRIKMSSQDFKMYLANEEDFKTQGWEAFLNGKLIDFKYFEDLLPFKTYFEDAAKFLKNFYDLVDRRDEAFLDNTNKIMTEEKVQAAYLVTGGYHTEHLTELLRKEGYSYVVLTPFVEYETDQSLYEKVLLEPLKIAKKNQSTDVSENQPEEIHDSKDTLMALAARLAAQQGARFASVMGVDGTRAFTSISNTKPNVVGSRMAGTYSPAKVFEVMRDLNHADRKDVIDQVGLYATWGSKSSRLDVTDKEVLHQEAVKFIQELKGLNQSVPMETPERDKVLRKNWDVALYLLDVSGPRPEDIAILESAMDDHVDALRLESVLISLKAHTKSLVSPAFAEKIRSILAAHYDIYWRGNGPYATKGEALNEALRNMGLAPAGSRMAESPAIIGARRDAFIARIPRIDSVFTRWQTAIADYVVANIPADRGAEFTEKLKTLSKGVDNNAGKTEAFLAHQDPADDDTTRWAKQVLSIKSAEGKTLLINSSGYFVGLRDDAPIFRELGAYFDPAIPANLQIVNEDEATVARAISLLDEIASSGLIEAVPDHIGLKRIAEGIRTARTRLGEKLALSYAVEELRRALSVHLYPIPEIYMETASAEARALDVTLNEKRITLLEKLDVIVPSSTVGSRMAGSYSPTKVFEVMRDLKHADRQDVIDQVGLYATWGSKSSRLDVTDKEVLHQEAVKFIQELKGLNQSVPMETPERDKVLRKNWDVALYLLDIAGPRPEDIAILESAWDEHVDMARLQSVLITLKDHTKDLVSPTFAATITSALAAEYAKYWRATGPYATKEAALNEALRLMGLPSVVLDAATQEIEGDQTPSASLAAGSRMSTRILTDIGLSAFGDTANMIVEARDLQLALPNRAGLVARYSDRRVLIQFISGQSGAVQTEADGVVRVAAPAEVMRFAGPDAFNAFNPSLAASMARRLVEPGAKLEINVAQDLFVDAFNKKLHQLFSDAAKRGGHDVVISGDFKISHPDYHQMYLVTPEALRSGQYTDLIRQGATVIAVNAAGLDGKYAQIFLVDLLGFALSGLDGKASSAQRFNEVTAQLQSALGIKISVKVALTLAAFENSPQAIEVIVEHTIPAYASKADIEAQALSLAQVVWAA